MKISYAFMVVSHPIQPSDGQLSAFLIKTLPELATSDGDGQLGFLWVTNLLNSVDITALAIDAFGNCIIDESKYIYRTLHLGIDGGEAKCLVVYEL